MGVAVAALVLLAPGVAQGMTDIGAVQVPVPARVFPIDGPHDPLSRAEVQGKIFELQKLRGMHVSFQNWERVAYTPRNLGLKILSRTKPSIAKASPVSISRKAGSNTQ